MQQNCVVDTSNLKRIFLIAKLDPKSETWRRVDERVKNALNVSDTSKVPFLDYHFTIYNVNYNGDHPKADVFEDPRFVQAVKQAYIDTFCSKPQLHLSSVYGKYDLFPKPTAQKPKPYPRNFVRHYTLVSHELDANGQVKRDSNGHKVTVNNVQLQQEAIFEFRKAFRNAVEKMLGCKLQRSPVQNCPGYTIYECSGKFIYAVPDYYHGVGVWEPHLSLFNEIHLNKNNHTLYKKEQSLATDDEKLQLLHESMSKPKKVEAISDIYFCRIPPGARGNQTMGDLPELTYSIDFKEISGVNTKPKKQNVSMYNHFRNQGYDPVFAEAAAYLDRGSFDDPKMGNKIILLPEALKDEGVLRNPSNLILTKREIEKYVDFDDFIQDIKDQGQFYVSRYLDPKYYNDSFRATNSDGILFSGKRTYKGMQQLVSDWIRNSLQ